jgi:hypothetical protein
MAYVPLTIAALLMMATARAEASSAFEARPIAIGNTRVFYNATVKEVVQTFNRYNTEQLVVTDPAIARQRIGGTLDLNDPEQFAAALERLLGLRAVREGSVIRLEKRNARR